MTAAPPKKSDLGVRTASAVVMLAVAGLALWLGGAVWTVFVLLIGFGVIREWSALVGGFAAPGPSRWLWTAAGAVYCGLAVTMLMVLRDGNAGMLAVLGIMAVVIATDIGAYFSGRAIGGPKIAPSISPSKTWAGLGGGMLAAAVTAMVATQIPEHGNGAPGYFPIYAAIGALIAIVAQAGDFFESWMKRRAGVKDSGRLIPGHGGLFDRVDGLLAVLFVIGLLYIAGAMTTS